MELFQELARIFSEENNQWAQRKLLIREGTAKFADTFGHNDRHLQKIIQKQQSTMSVSYNYNPIIIIKNKTTQINLEVKHWNYTLPGNIFNRFDHD